MTLELPRISWIDAEAARVEHEQAEMQRWAPDVHWRTDLAWPDGRPGADGRASLPRGELIDPSRRESPTCSRPAAISQVICPEAFPMVAPDLYPIDPEVPIDRRTQHKWHVNGDGSLCLMQAAETGRLRTRPPTSSARRLAGTSSTCSSTVATSTG